MQQIHKFIAHKSENGDVQELIAHLKGTADLSADFSSDFDALDQGKLVGMAHDIGKYSKEFQKRILENGPKVDHSTAGAFLCAKMGQKYAAFCVAGHHGGLPDLGGRDDESEGTLRARLNRANKGEIPDFSAWKDELQELPKAKEPSFSGIKGLSDAFFTRMLYSCLVDADYLDTESFMKAGQVERGCDIHIEELEQRLDKYINKWFPPKGELNEKRCAILQNCIENGKFEQGMFTLTVPTGGGKTVASLAFALKHAKEYGLKRIIYIIPYTSIIEQTAEVFREILGNDVVLEHHCNVEYDEQDMDSETAMKMSLATENWDMPIIVTTAVQFFESLYANKSSKCRKLHNIAKSVVIFDEAQMLPIPFLKPCVYAITELVKNYHVSAVLCTATQPSLDTFIQEYLDDYTLKELCPKELSSDQIFKRTVITNKGKVTWDEVADEMNRHQQILCVVNSRKNAQELFERIKGEGSYHLSTFMIPAERKRILKEIKGRLSMGKVCRVVSTSLIEAGVDVDFPVAMRELAGLDSILQTAGRCNREGKRSLEKSVVSVFNTEGRTPPFISANVAACKYALERNEDIGSSETIRCYFSNLYDYKGEKELDKKGIIDMLSNGKLRFQEAARCFKLIDDSTFAVYIPLGEGKSLIDRRKYGEMSKELMRILGQYSVNIYEMHLKALYEAGDVEPLGESEWVLTNLALYNFETGLSTKADNGKGIFT